jgi:hypothetical protein
MAKGKNRQQIIGMQGGILSDKYADWDFLYRTSTAKDPLYNIGDTVRLPDKRAFTYAKSAAACIPGQAAEFTYTGYIAITTFTVAAAVGAKTISVPAATHAALTVDELRNGYVVIYDGTTNQVQFRGIVGNDASILNVAFNLQLDASLTEAITTSSKIEVFQNPYAALQTATSTTLAKAGVPVVPVSAANMYFWLQTEGPIWIAPQSGVGAQGGIGCFWRHDGSIESTDTALAVTTAANDLSQYAGFTISGTAAGNGPLFMLK